jgi:hypothetical protein
MQPTMGRRTTTWDPTPQAALDRFGDKCHAWPHCSQKHLPDGRFCSECQAALDRVKASLSTRSKGNIAKALAPSVTVSHVAPRGRVTRAEYRRRIRAALVAGLRTSAELAADCDTDCDDGTFRRARLDLIAKCEVLDLGRSAGGRLYELPAPEPSKPPSNTKAERFREAVLASLQGGTRTSRELALACDTDGQNDRTLSRVRIKLEREGLVVCLGKAGSRQYRYALAPTA